MSEPKHQLQRSLGLIDATSIVAGSMIGSGIFVVTVYMARDLGSAAWILITWLITGLLSAALSYGELAGMMPTAGGQFVYIQRAYGKLASFLYGWTVFTVIQTGVIAAVAVTFANYTAVFFPFLQNEIFRIDDSFVFKNSQVLAMLSIAFLTYINTKGVKNGKIIQLVFTSAKLIALFALIVFGLYIGFHTDTFSNNFNNTWDASKTVIDEATKTVTVTKLTGIALAGTIGATIINSLFSSDAWNNVTFIAGEIKDPKKNIPRSLFLGTLIVTVIYILANIAYLALLPLNGTIDGSVTDNGIMFAAQDRVGTAAANMIMGNIGVFVMAALIMISTFGCNSGLILSGGRLFYAMAKDSLFFKQAGELNDHDVPAKALWFQCFWACILCISGKYGDLLTYATFASLLFYILTIYGIFILRKKEPNAERPYKAFGYPLIPALYILVTAAICVALLINDTVSTGLGLAIVALGIPIYYLFLHNKE
jgi:APA family basic amino acid/polyamine antiporter